MLYLHKLEKTEKYSTSCLQCLLSNWLLDSVASSQASNLLSFVAEEPHYLWDAVPWRGWADNPTRLRTSIPDTGTHTPGMTLPRRAWVRLNRLRTGVGRFRSCPYKWGMATSAACECGAEQTADHVVLHCPIHRPPTDFTAWRFWTMRRWDNRLNTCPDI